MKELLRKFKAVIRFNWQGDLEYRSYFLFWAFMESLPFLIMFFLWKFIYNDQSMVAGYDLHEMITYYFLVYVVNRITANYIEWNLSGRIKSGMFAQFLYRPISHRIYYLASLISERVLVTTINLPVFLVGLVIFHRYITATSPISLALFILALPTAIMLNFIFALIIGYFAFWMEKSDSIIYFRWSLTYYLSGQFLPLIFFGETISKFLGFLPFKYFFGFPIELYLGRLTVTQIWSGFIIGLSWVLIFVAIERIMYIKGIKRFKAIGN